jgi:D-alanyl-D-alanine carboxypeptidase
VLMLSYLPAEAKKTKSPVEPARAVLVFNKTTGTVADQLNAHTAIPIASVTKLMTAFVVLESHADMDEKLVVIPQKIEGSRVLRTGMTITRRELLNLALISSDNLAAKLLAVHHPQGYDSFINEMNTTAQRLGMVNTHYIEPTGLLQNTSTAWDLHLLNQAIAKYKTFSDAAMSASASADAQNKRGIWQRFVIHNTNAFAGKYNIIIGKTGFTNPAGWCIDMRIGYREQEFDIIVLGSPNKKIRNDLVANKLNDYMNFITRNAVIFKIDNFDGDMFIVSPGL